MSILGYSRLAAVAASALALGAAGAAHATIAFPDTSELSLYSVVSVGPHASLTINSGPIQGKVLAGDGATVSTSGGNNGSIVGGAFVDSASLLTKFSGLQVKPTVTLVPTTDTTTAFNEAAALQTFLDGLTADTTIAGQLTGTVGLSANGGADGVTTINFGSLQNATLTLTGGVNDIFVLRTSGNVNTNHVMSLVGGLKADHVIWDLDGTSGNVLQTSGGNILEGAFIDTKGGNFQFSELNLTGQLINTGGHIQFVSGSRMGFAPLTPPTVPEPAAWALMLLGFFGVGGAVRMRRRSLAA